MTNCPNCGKPNEDIQSNCIDCGQSLTAETAVNDPAPTFTEDQPQAATEASAETFFGQAPSFTPAPVSPPKKKSRLGLYLGGGILGVAAVVGIVFLVLAMMNPMRAIASAASRTMEALKTRAGTFTTLEAYGEAYNTVAEADRNAEEITITMGAANADAFYIKALGLTDYTTKTGSAEFSIGVENGGSIVLPIYVDEKSASFAAPQFLEDATFYITYEELSQMLGESSGVSLDIEEMRLFERDGAGYTEEQLQLAQKLKIDFAAMIASLKPQELEPVTHGDQQWTPYLLTFDEAALATVMDDVEAFYQSIGDSFPEAYLELLTSGFGSYDDFVDELMEALSWVVNEATVYLHDGYMVGYSFVSGDDITCLLALEGQINPWDRFTLYDDGEEIMHGEITNEGDILSLTMTDETDTIRLTYTDATGEVALYLNDEQPLLTLSMGAVDGKATIACVMAQDDLEIGVSYVVSTTDEPITTLPVTKLYELAELTEEESEALLTELYMALFTDEELYTIIEEIGEALSVFSGI